MKLRKGFITHTLFGEQMMTAVGPAAKVFHGLVHANETAARIIDCLKQETSAEAIVQTILEEYDAEEAVVRADVAEVLEQLRSIGAIDED